MAAQLETTKFLGYGVLRPSDVVEIAKFLGYGVLRLPDAVETTKFIGYAALRPTDATVVTKLIAYAVLDTKTPPPPVPSILRCDAAVSLPFNIT